MATWSIAQVQLSGGDLSNNLLQTLAEPSLVFDSILRQGAFDSCQQLTSYKVKWSIAEAGWPEEKTVITSQVLTRTMSQQSDLAVDVAKNKRGTRRRASKGLTRWQQHCRVGYW